MMLFSFFIGADLCFNFSSPASLLEQYCTIIRTWGMMSPSLWCSHLYLSCSTMYLSVWFAVSSSTIIICLSFLKTRFLFLILHSFSGTISKSLMRLKLSNWMYFHEAFFPISSRMEKSSLNYKHVKKGFFILCLNPTNSSINSKSKEREF